MFMMMIAMLGGTYQLPLYYQAVSAVPNQSFLPAADIQARGRSPEQSGIDIIRKSISHARSIAVR